MCDGIDGNFWPSQFSSQLYNEKNTLNGHFFTLMWFLIHGCYSALLSFWGFMDLWRCTRVPSRGEKCSHSFLFLFSCGFFDLCHIMSSYDQLLARLHGLSITETNLLVEQHLYRHIFKLWTWLFYGRRNLLNLSDVKSQCHSSLEFIFFTTLFAMKDFAPHCCNVS